jgi:hypothetical protein
MRPLSSGQCLSSIASATVKAKIWIKQAQLKADHNISKTDGNVLLGNKRLKP